MPANVETSFLAKEAAWWGFQILTDETLTTEDAFEKSGLRWTIEKRPLFVPTFSAQYIDGKLVIPKTLDDFMHVEERFAVMRKSDNAILGTVGTDWQPIQNVQAFDFLDGLTAAQGGMAKWESAGSLRGGRRIWALLHVPDSDLHLPDGVVQSYILVTLHHDGTASMIAKIVGRRVVCENTLDFSLGEHTQQVRIRHTGDVQHKLKVAQMVFADAIGASKAFEVFAQELGEVRADRDTLDHLIDELFPPVKPDEEGLINKNSATRRENNVLLLKAAAVEELKLLPSPNPSMWTMLNVVTRFSDHSKLVQTRKRDNNEVRFESALMGGGDKFKNAAAKTIAKMAGVKLPSAK